MLVRPESNSRPPAWQPGAQPTEPPVRGGYSYPILNNWGLGENVSMIFVTSVFSLTAFLSIQRSLVISIIISKDRISVCLI